MRMIDYAMRTTNDYVEHMPKSLRKKSGQFFTSEDTAVFMAGLFEIPVGKRTISVLDPGSGTGLLAAAALDRLQTISTIEKIELVCYENDPAVLGALEANLQWFARNSSKAIDFKIIHENYILSQADDYNQSLFANGDPRKYDLVICNPPYMKVSKDAPEARAMESVCHGAPNLYFLFASMGMFNLVEGGQLVLIIPRSWMSGAYFRKFRKRFFSQGVLERIHLFASRKEVFEDVLQETMVIRMRKTRVPPGTVVVTTSLGDKDFSGSARYEAPYETVVRDQGGCVCLASSQKEVETLNRLDRLKDTLPSIGLKMRTGLAVDFRCLDALRDQAGSQAVPLFHAHHIREGKVVFPLGRENEYIVANRRGLLQRNSNYLFVKRFTSKEERRRLQCGVYLARKHPEYTQISTENKINFVDGADSLSECVVFGLYVLFNSTLYDRYYRILDGSTQVNSTEINSMPVPPLGTIEEMGKMLIRAKDMSEASCDEILRIHI